MASIRSLLHASPLALAAVASAQGAGIPVFTVDWRGATIALPDSFTGTPITEGDLLAPFLLTAAIGPLATPGIVESGGSLAPAGLNLALHLGCVGHPPGVPCVVEVDALSHGLDRVVGCGGTPGLAPAHWAFSVSFRGLGQPGSPTPPNVESEGACADEAADVFIDLGVPCGPTPPGPVVGNTGYLDGNGLVNACGTSLYPGLGLIEAQPAPPQNDNLDGLDDDVPDRWLPSTTCTYFSLDSAFVDPVLLVPNSGSAAAHGFVGGAVLMTCPGCAPAVYATPLQLGLDLGGADTDDLDALVLRENGIAGYQRSTMPYDWTNGASDMLFFSVRRGSMLVGTPDAFFGQPIEPGDILVPTGPVGSPPGIWVPAEALGLSTARTAPGIWSDDIDALDVLHAPPPGTGFCPGDGSGTLCPCGNNGAPGRGCGNSVNALGGLLWANGFASLSFDSVMFTTSGLPPVVSALLFQGTAQVNGGNGAVFGDGLRCVAGNVIRVYRRQTLCGNREFGHSVPGDLPVSVAGGISGPGTYLYQVWYRNATAFCTPSTFNLTNGYRITWTP